MSTFNLFFMLKLALKHIVALVLAAVISAVGAYFYFRHTVVPKYAATGSVLVTNGSIVPEATFTDNTKKVENGDLITSLNFAETVIDILKTNDIYKRLSVKLAAENPDKYYSYGQLKGMASIKRRNEETLFIDVTFTAATAQEAINIVNNYLELVPDYMLEYVQNTATKPTKADSASLVYVDINTMTLLAAVGGALVVYAIIFIISSSDAVIRDEESFASRFDTPVIGVIPDFARAKTKESKYYKYSKYGYGKYGRYGRYGRYGYGYGYGYGGNKNDK